MQSKTTVWFSGTETPVWKGVYQTKANELPGYWWFNYWNGRRWTSGGYRKAEDAYKYRNESQYDDVDYWRGLVRHNV